MQLIHTILLLLCTLIQLARAQNGIQAMPTCAINCMEVYVPQSACSITDQNCLCTNVDLQQVLTSCVVANCTVKEGLTAQNFTAQACGVQAHDAQPLLRAVTVPFIVVATLFFLARIAARLPMFGGEFGFDDYMITVSYFLALAFSVLLLLMASAGLGKDIWETPFSDSNDQVTYTLQLFIAFEKTYILAVWCTKISILLLYLRIFPDSKFRINAKLALAFCAATAFCLFWACLFKCWPISYSWTYWDGEHHGSCSSQNAQGWANAGLNIFGDLLVLALPLPTIWKMSLSKGKRFGITFMFGVGIFITVVSMVRLYTLRVFNFSQNPTWDFVNLCLWSVIEVDVGIMCACLPGTRNFYNRVILGKIMGKGAFAPGAPRAGSANTLERQASGSSQHSYSRSPSAASHASSTTMTAQIGAVMPKEFILVVNDIRSEKRDSGSPQGVYRWPGAQYDARQWTLPCKH